MKSSNLHNHCTICTINNHKCATTGTWSYCLCCQTGRYIFHPLLLFEVQLLSSWHIIILLLIESNNANLTFSRLWPKYKCWKNYSDDYHPVNSSLLALMIFTDFLAFYFFCPCAHQCSQISVMGCGWVMIQNISH